MKRDEAMGLCAMCAVCAVAAIATAAASGTSAWALDNPLTVTLRGTKSHLTEAKATIFGSGSNVLVDVTRYRGVDNGAAVTLNTGPCRHPGDVAFGLSPFTKHGSVTELRHSLAEVAARARSMVIHQGASRTSPASACGAVVD